MTTDQRPAEPVEIRSLSNGARWGMVSAITALCMLVIAVMANVFLSARWIGRTEGLMEKQNIMIEMLEDRASRLEEIDREQEIRFDDINRIDAIILERLYQHMEVTGG
jgi:hypothetical protein